VSDADANRSLCYYIINSLSDLELNKISYSVYVVQMICGPDIVVLSIDGVSDGAGIHHSWDSSLVRRIESHYGNAISVNIRMEIIDGRVRIYCKDSVIRFKTCVVTIGDELISIIRDYLIEFDETFDRRLRLLRSATSNYNRLQRC
jgi:hypothetical protein